MTLAGAVAASSALLESRSQSATASSAFTGKNTPADGNPDTHLVLDYQPSQPTGWGQGFTPSIGGHATAREFTFNGTGYRVSLTVPDPVYEDIPSDPGVKFRQTLAASFGRHYSFRYQGGLTGRSQFSVKSYNVWVNRQGPTTFYGAELYVVYRPGHGGPVINSNLQWIQVIDWQQGPPPSPAVDNDLRANPFYIAGGLTSINGIQTVTFADQPQKGVDQPQKGVANGNIALSDRFVSEVFLAQDTGLKDAAGKAIVNIFGGLKYGWQVTRS